MGRLAILHAVCICLLPFSVGRAEVLTIDGALSVAMENSPTIRQARNSLESAEQSLKAENASLKSQFSLSLTPITMRTQRQKDEATQVWYTYESKGSSASFSVNQRLKLTDAQLWLSNDFGWSESSSDRGLLGKTTDTKYTNSLSLNLRQPLFTYNQTKMALKELELDYERARLEYELEKLDIERMVTTQFYSVYRSHMNLEIAREEFKNKEESYGIIRNKVEAGISAEEELYQAEVDFATSRAALENRQVEYENTLDRFKILLGLSLQDELEVVADVEKTVVEVDLDQAVRSGLESRMELRNLDISIEMAGFELTRIGSENEFEAYIDVSYGLTGDDEEFRNIYDDPLRSQSISVGVYVPLWDWGKKKSRMKARELQLDNQVIGKEDRTDQIVLEIRQAYRSLQSQLTQIDIAEKSLENAQLTYEINLERYRNGDISSKDIGEYQNQLSREKLRHIGALIDYKLYLLDLKVASLWDFESDKPVLEIN